jgi:two-component system chemotaxis sensor kinase CheA
LGKPETGTIYLEASHSGNNVFICVRDDGAGINLERIRRRLVERGLVTESALQELTEQQVVDFIWHPGFSTAEQVTDISGRGVGMDVVRSRIVDLNGDIEVESAPGQGTTFTLRLPLTLAIIRSLLVRFQDGLFSIPIDDVREIVSVPPGDIHTVHNCRTIDVRGRFIPVVAMTDVFEWSTFHQMASTAVAETAAPVAVNVVVLRCGDKSIGLCVDELLGGADVVIKSLADNFIDIRGLSGASVMGDGTVCLMLDANTLTELAAERARTRETVRTMAR